MGKRFMVISVSPATNTGLLFKILSPDLFILKYFLEMLCKYYIDVKQMLFWFLYKPVVIEKNINLIQVAGGFNAGHFS